MQTARTLTVCHDGEWGEFFVSEREPRICKDGTREYTQYTVTWCCYSSFGVYGHHWYAMG